MKKLYLFIKLFVFRSIDKNLISEYLDYRPDIDAIFEILRNISEKNNDCNGYQNLKSYIIKKAIEEKREGYATVEMLDYFPELKKDNEYIRKCLFYINDGDFRTLKAFLKYEVDVDIIVEKIIKYNILPRNYIYPNGIEELINNKHLRDENRTAILDAFVASGAFTEEDIVRMLRTCPFARTHQKLLHEFIYLNTLTRLTSQNKINTVSNQGNNVTNQSSLVDDLVLLATGAVIGSALADAIGSSPNSSDSL